MRVRTYIPTCKYNPPNQQTTQKNTQVKDTVYLGGDALDAPTRGGAALGMPFVFGCQTYETGLFRTQLENGIMGLSFQDLTIVPKLKVCGV